MEGRWIHDSLEIFTLRFPWLKRLIFQHEMEVGEFLKATGYFPGKVDGCGNWSCLLCLACLSIGWTRSLGNAPMRILKYSSENDMRFDGVIGHDLQDEWLSPPDV